MELTVGLKLLVAAVTVLLACRTSGAIACTANSVDDCISQSQIWQLQQDNSNYFCTEGPRRVRWIYDCIAACNLSPVNNQNLIQVTVGIDSFCSEKESQCGLITERYVNFTKCYVSELTSILDGIIESYNDDNVMGLYSHCQWLAWGRNCQMQLVGDCPFLESLYSADMTSDYLITAAFYVCGAESNGKFVYIDNNSCNDNMAALVETQCAATCNILSATNKADVCGVLQSQVDCIMRTTKGCSSVQMQYIVPRLASYWAANELFGCEIQISNIIIWARAPQCHVGSLLSACFNLSSASFTTIDGIKQLLTMQFPMSPLCNLLQTPGVTSAWLAHECLSAMTSCIIPLGQVYNWPTFSAPPTTYATTPYGPLLGPFALNAWGLNTLIGNLELFTCQATGHVQCATTPSLPTTTLRQTARVTKRVTPSPRATPKAVNNV